MVQIHIVAFLKIFLTVEYMWSLDVRSRYRDRILCARLSIDRSRRCPIAGACSRLGRPNRFALWLSQRTASGVLILRPPQQKNCNALMSIAVFGRGDRIRTCDILLPKQARYQAALHPVIKLFLFSIHQRARCLRHPRLRRLLRFPKFFARSSLRIILTATPTHPPSPCHRQRSDVLPKAGALPSCATPRKQCT